MKIQKIRIRNYRNIKDLEVDFSANTSGAEKELLLKEFKKISSGKMISNIYGFIGPNSIGKSNTLMAIENALNIINGEFDFETKFNILKSYDKLNLKMNEQRSFIDEFMENNGVQYEQLKKKVIQDYYSKNFYDMNKPIIFELHHINGIDISTINIYNDSYSEDNVKNFKGYKSTWCDKQTFYLEESNLFGFKGGSPLENDLKKYDPSVLLKFVRIADPSIEKIEKTDSNEFKLISSAGKMITLKELSTGTKLFLHTINSLYKITQRDKMNGIFIIDELSAFMHRELAEAIIIYMKMITKRFPDITILFTTHNMAILQNTIKYKRTIEIAKDSNGKHIAIKSSTKMKPHESLESKNKKGFINPFPSSAFVYDNLIGTFDE